MVSYVRVQIIHVAAELNRYMLHIEPNVLFNVLFFAGHFCRSPNNVQNQEAQH